MIDGLDLDNSLQTIGWNRSAVRGFESEAYGATLLLIHFIDQLTLAGRLAWVNANNCRSDIGQAGILKTRKGFFLSSLNQLRLGVYGTNFDDTSVKMQPSRVAYPWSLSDHEFSYCMLYIKTGRKPDTAKFTRTVLTPNEQMVIDKVGESLKKKALQYLEMGAIAVGGYAIETLFKVKNSTPGGVAFAIAESLLAAEMERIELKDLTARYAIDERRRLHLSTQGLSNYQVMAGL